MAAMIIMSGTTSGSGIAGVEEIRTAFIENNQALTWLAEFLTGDEMIASACVIDACNLTERGCIHEHQAPLPQDMIGFVASESDVIRHKLDVLCRFALILCGVERRPPGEAALMMGISQHAVEVAYCAAIDSLEIIRCQAILEAGGYVVMAN